MYAHTDSNSRGEEGKLQNKTGEEKGQRPMEGGVRVLERENIVLAQALVVKLQ